MPGSRVLFLGQPSHNKFTHSLGCNATFLDLSLGNWEINTGPWPEGGYDAVVCTRSAYFSQEPEEFVSRCMAALVTGGVLYADWGLGDHWRFPKFLVGWRDAEVHEFAQVGDHKSFLQSCVWSDKIEVHPSSLLFKQRIQKHGYGGPLLDHVKREVPRVMHVEDSQVVDCLALWDDLPQLYILTRFRK